MTNLDKAVADLNKKYGEGTIMRYKDMKPLDIQRVSSGLPSVDYVMGGGIPVGRVISIYGPESSGKTTLAIKFLAQMQKAYPKDKVAFIDVEHALDPDYAQVLGLNMDDLYLSQPDTAEIALDTLDKIVCSGEFKCVVLDSVAQLTTEKELAGEMGDAEMGGRARLMGQALRKITPAAAKNDCTVIFINQIRMKLGPDAMYGNPETQPGGKALPYMSSIVIRTSSKKDPDGMTGQTTIDVKKNKVGKPFRKTTIRMQFGKGFDEIDDIVTAALQTGVIKKNGPMSVFGDKKWKGEELMRKEISENPELQKEISDVIINSSIGKD